MTVECPSNELFPHSSPIPLFLVMMLPYRLLQLIVTIQVGDYANYVGSHFWNLQDEFLGLADSPEADPAFENHGLDMNAIYRVGETLQGIQTYTPRLVSIGFQGSLGSVSSQGTLYNVKPSVKPEVNTW
ncbi:hypothetical protein LIER_23041 [Lithospermum erythrorhizon]|uniref:Misato Segment II tubulin-like domain-containing protein n=1 Tax=Lithospermum erythrorhizon TaxID=34254 RepID=A0AAV3QZ60_LITER